MVDGLKHLVKALVAWTYSPPRALDDGTPPPPAMANIQLSSRRNDRAA